MIIRPIKLTVSLTGSYTFILFFLLTVDVIRRDANQTIKQSFKKYLLM